MWQSEARKAARTPGSRGKSTPKHLPAPDFSCFRKRRHGQSRQLKIQSAPIEVKWRIPVNDSVPDFTDFKAPIFKVADYAIVGDIFQIVPLLTKKIREFRGR